MASKDPKQGNFKGAFSPDDLEILDVAYQAAWANLELPDPEKAEAVKRLLRQQIVETAKHGVRDPKKLAGLALERAAAKISGSSFGSTEIIDFLRWRPVTCSSLSSWH
jgi:hypothetical protein